MKRLAYILLLLLPAIGMAQNRMHLGQYMVHQPFFNPASIASYENLNGALIYKNQWMQFEGAPTVQGLNVNAPIKKGKHFIGLTVLNDQIGINNSTEISGSYAYKIKTGIRSRLSFGVSAMVNLMQSDYAELHIQDANDPMFQANSPTYAMPNFSFGAYYYRRRFYAGLAIPNLLENKIIYSDGYSGETEFNASNLHYYLHVGKQWVLGPKWDLNTSTLFKEVEGASLQMDFNIQTMYKKKVGVGASYRTSNELLAMATIDVIDGLRLSYGYEFNFSDIGDYSTGTHEIILVYNYMPPNEPVVVIPRF